MSNFVSSLGRAQLTSLSSFAEERRSRVSAGQRLVWLDAIKGIAACIIVGHHLSLYSPSSDLADQFAPSLMYGLYFYGLFVVQMFLVFGGFGLAMALSDQPISWKKSLASFGSRYVRLAAPYLVMLLLLTTVSWSTLGGAMQPPLIDSFSWWQLLAHIFFLQDILGFGNLSAGTWYLCIDLQYVGLFLIIRAGLHSFGKLVNREFFAPVAMSALLIPLGIASAWIWNRSAQNESYVFYFLGSLVLGTLAAWTLKGHVSKWVLLLYALALAASLTIDFRPRILVALGSVIVIYLVSRFGSRLSVPRPLLWLGKISYSLFLIHYLVNGLVLHGLASWIGDSPFRAFASMVVALFASLGAATVLHFAVEAPCHRWLKSLATKSLPRSSHAFSVQSLDARGADMCFAMSKELPRAELERA